MRHVRGFFALIGVLCVLLLFFSSSYAQFPGMDPSMNPMGMVRDMQFGPLMLLSRSEVHRELKLNKSQIENLKKLQKEHAKLLSDQMKAGQSSDVTRMMELMKQVQATQAEFNSKSKSVLTDEQRQRFSEIRLQVMGFQSLQDQEYQMALGLTAEQKSGLSVLNTDYMTAKMNSARNASSTGSYKRKLEAVEKEYQEKFSGILTADQNNLLKKMQGEPFKDVKKLDG